ncbi:MAG: ribosome silencing factor [Treponema sp.]|jgi:ribosome-associated protein|nr:ribosome silencing factor [Treponema sp.]
MEDMLEETSAPAGNSAGETAALALGELLREHKGTDVLVLDLREMNAWTDFFVIATASSSTHLQGLERHIRDFCGEQGLDILRRSRKPDSGDNQWHIIDLGSIVVHLMSAQVRSFYELERLYSPAAVLTHSSKSPKSSSSSS